MSQYNPASCHGAVEVYGIYICRWNGGVPCALYKGEMCYLEKVDKATNELIKAMKEKEATEDVKSRPGMEQTRQDDSEAFS